MSKLCPACGSLLYPDLPNLIMVCMCGYTDECTLLASNKVQPQHPTLPRDLSLVGKCFIPPRSILIATYGTLKRERAYALPTERGTFMGMDRIPCGQLHINKEMRVWPIITAGNSIIECDLYLVDGMNFNRLKTGEEANGYKTVLTKLWSGRTAYVWWYDVFQLGTAWEPIDEY